MLPELFGGIFGLILIIFLIILFIVWTIFPFYVIAIHNRLQEFKSYMLFKRKIKGTRHNDSVLFCSKCKFEVPFKEVECRNCGNFLLIDNAVEWGKTKKKIKRWLNKDL